MKKPVLKYLKFALLGALITHLGAPWNLSDGPVCAQNIGLQQDCGYKAFYHRSWKGWKNQIQLNLIQDAVRDRPVIANIELKEPNGCDTGLTLGKADNLFVLGSAFIGQQNESACPIISSAKGE